jgi:MoaA/NifB/PqqE/SkfB family radical SAM enzyme
VKSLIFNDVKLLPSLGWRCLKWHLNYLFTNNPLPLSCVLSITSKCNFRCNFCSFWRKKNIRTLSFEKAKKIINDLSSLDCFYLSLTGGETLLVDYLVELLTYARKSNIKYLHIVTNGYLLDNNMAIKFSDVGMNDISISIDGDEEFHDKKRNVSGAYQKAMAAIKNLKKYSPRTKIVLNGILFPENPEQCLHVLRLAREYDVYVKFQPLNRHPIFDRDNCAPGPSTKFTPLELKNIITKLKEDRRVINSHLFLDNIYNYYFQRKKLIFKDSFCAFGYHHIEISENAHVFPCFEGLAWNDGMTSDGSLRELIQSSEYKEVLEKLRKCEGCQRNIYICYYEPRIVFPIGNLLYSLCHNLKKSAF